MHIHPHKKHAREWFFFCISIALSLCCVLMMAYGKTASQAFAFERNKLRNMRKMCAFAHGTAIERWLLHRSMLRGYMSTQETKPGKSIANRIHWKMIINDFKCYFNGFVSLLKFAICWLFFFSRFCHAFALIITRNCVQSARLLVQLGTVSVPMWANTESGLSGCFLCTICVIVPS